MGFVWLLYLWISFYKVLRLCYDSVFSCRCAIVDLAFVDVLFTR